MSTTNLTIIEGKIDKIRDRYTDNYDDHHYNGNGWTVTVSPTLIKAICEREYSKGIFSITIIITSDKMISIKKENNVVYDKKIKRINYNGNGMIGLSGGDVRERYGYWRDQEFQNLLSEYGITAVAKLQLINDTYRYVARFARYGGGSCCTKIWTDGEGKFQYSEIDYGRTREWQASYYNTEANEMDLPIIIKSPTVVIIETDQDEGNNHNYSKILYTNIKSIPEIREAISKSNKVQ